MMLKSIVAFSIRFRGIVIALACLALGWGVYVTLHARLAVLPEFSPPQVVIQTEAPGLSSEQVEALVTQRLENALNGLSGLEYIRSESIQGLSVVTLGFHAGDDIFRARQLVGERLLQTAGEMPQGVAVPVMAPLTTATSWVQTVALTSRARPLMDLWTFAYWTLRLRLLAVPGVAKVAIYGGGVRQLQIQVEPARLLAYHLSIDDVLAAARRSTAVAGAGFVDTANQRIVLQTRGQSLSPEELGSVVLRYHRGAGVRLDDVARVRWASKPPIGYATIMGHPGVILQVSGQYGANTLQVSEGLDRALRALAPEFRAQDITLHPAIFRADTVVETAIGNIRSSLLIGAVLVAIVLTLFLYDLRSAFISLTAIPLSLLIAVIVLDARGFTLNAITLGGLAIAIGEVVDDAIIDVENILRRLRLNRAEAHPRPVFDVILDASLEVRSAVVYATFVVAAVFIPLLAMSGVAGRIFAPLGWAYIFAVLASLGVALTLTPALCFILLPGDRHQHETAFVGSLKSVHRRWLEAAVARPGLVIAAAAVLCAGAIAILPLFGGSFLPEMQEPELVLHMVGIPGTSIEESVRVGDRVTRLLAKDPHIRSIAQRVGRAELGDDTFGPQISEFDIRLRQFSDEDIGTVEAHIRRGLANLDGWDFSMNPFLTERLEETLSGEMADLAIKIYGSDLAVLDEKAHQVARILRGIRGAVDVRVKSPGGMPELMIDLLPNRLQQLGFRPVDVLDAIQTAYQGTAATQIYQGNRSFDVSVILAPAARRDPESVGSLMLRNSAGTLVPLRELASIDLGAGRYSVLHEAGRRVQVVTCDVRGRDVESFSAEAQRKVESEVAFPPGVYAEFTGAARARARSVRDIELNSIIAAVVVVCMLFIAFGSLRHLLLVLANVPFALVGGVIAAWVAGGELSLGSMVGFVTLFGITMRNSIMLLSHFDHLVTVEGMTWGPAAAVRGASERLLPILMTALVTGLGLLPLAIGSGAPGREIEGPMAIIILGGLFTSTALNLLVLPSLALRYAKFDTADPASGTPDRASV
jgi:CzcA family heavy metal efflux pump